MVSAGIELVGCYSSVDTSSGQGTDTYMTSSLCASRCPNSPYLALQNGDDCYCLSKKPSGLGLASGCNVGCFGFDQQMCGGSSSFSVYTGNGVEDSEPDSSSAAETQSETLASASSSSATTKSNSVSETESASETDSATEAETESATKVTSTRSLDGSVVVKTVTALASSTAASQTTTSLPLPSATSEPKKKDSSPKVGPIVGGVVGGIAAIAIIALVAFFLMRKRKQDDDYDEEEFYDKSEIARGGTKNLKRGKPSPLDLPMANPFTDPSDSASGGKSGLVDPRLNPMMMGRRRLSEGSLADETDYSRKILQVANPDH